MSKSCSHLREEFIECIRESPCMVENKKTYYQCLELVGNDPSIPEECQAIRYAHFQCKRGQLDMRKRFRGNKDTV